MIGLVTNTLEKKNCTTCLDVTRLFVDKESCRVALCIVPGLDSSIFSIDIVTWKGDNPRQGVIKLYQYGKSIFALSINFQERRKATLHIFDLRKSISERRKKNHGDEFIVFVN